MSCPIGTEELKKLEMFIGFCSDKPEILNMPQLKFFKDFVEKIGGKVPEATADFSFDEHCQQEKTTVPEPERQAPSDPESDVDIDNEGCVEPDTDADQPMGDKNKIPSEEDIDKAGELRSKAAGLYSERLFDEAVAAYEEAIILNPTNALFYAKRGQAYLKLNKPNACIRDCNRALELNCDSAAAYKFRGRAHRLLGDWQAAAKDLRQACNIDYDEEADEWLRDVQPKAQKLEAHKVKQERKKAERELRERAERVRRAQEANRKAAEEQQRQSAANDHGPFSGAGGPFGGGGGNPFGGAGGNPFGGAGGPFGGAGGAAGFSQQDILDAFKDPEVAAAFQDITTNPANVIKYQNNAKIMNIITKIGGAMGGGGFPNMPPGGGAFPNFQTPPPHPPKPSAGPADDDGLD